MVNDVLVNYFVVESPLGGWKSSGLGVRHGVESLRQWTRIEAMTETRPLLAPVEGSSPEGWPFPTSEGFSSSSGASPGFSTGAAWRTSSAARPDEAPLHAEMFGRSG